jgi:DNA processing protein
MRELTERDAWIVLSSVDGIGHRRFTALLERYGSASEVLVAAARGSLPALLPGVGARTPAAVGDAVTRVARSPDDVLRRLRELDLWTLTPLDPGWPHGLLDLEQPPAVLHGWGSPSLLRAERMVAVVGTRRPTPAGRLLAARIADRLAGLGAVVVSGLAFGIDGAAHAAALDAGGGSVGVIGSGHGTAGPRAHRLLVDRMRDVGAVVSELAPDTRPTKGTFPLRNRLIAALAQAVVVVEAPGRSGALITARRGLELGRPVFAAPGRPGDPVVAGCLALLRETAARPVASVEALVADLEADAWPLPTRGERTAGSSPGRRSSGLPSLEALALPERAVVTAIRQGPMSVDALVRATGLAPGVVSASVTLLQLRGWIEPHGALYLPAGPLLPGG